MPRKNHNRRCRPTAKEIKAIMAFYGFNEEKPRSIHTPKITITQTIIEF